MAGICATWQWSLAHTRYAQSGCSLHCFDYRRASCYSLSCLPAMPTIWWGIQLWGLGKSHLIPLLSLHGWEGSSFPGLAPYNDMVDSESAVDIKPGNSGVLIGYQVDEFTGPWSAEQFVAHSHIYPGFTGSPQGCSC